MWRWILFALPCTVFADTHWTVPVGDSRVLRVPGLEGVATGEKKIARAAVAGTDRVVVTALRPGTTTIRAWSPAGEQTVVVRVVAQELAAPEEGSGLVRVALEFLEVDGALSESLGIRWPDALQFSAAAQVQGTMESAALSYSIPFASGRAFLAHLSRRGWAHVLARPELFVRLGEEARFHSGGEFPIANTVSTQAGFSRQVDWKKYGLTVKVRPQSKDWIRFHADVLVELSEINMAGGGDGVPALLRRELDTHVVAIDGETLVLSGLLRELSGRDREGIPFLSAIPILGALFSRSNERRERTELFLAMTLSVPTRSSIARAVDQGQQRLSQPKPPQGFAP